MQPLALLLPALSLTLASSFSSLYSEVPDIFSDDSAGYGPVFEELPMDTIYPEESPEAKITLSCRARANPPATYRWRLEKVEIDLDKTADDHYRLEGGNLVISKPDKSKHVGNYTCEATNSYGTVISRKATVQFGFLDAFATEEREAVFVKEGQGAVLLCAPPPHYPDDLSFRWMLNEFPVFILPSERQFVSQTNGNLYISKVVASDSGNYSCFMSSRSIAKSVFSKFIPLVPLSDRHPRKYPADIKVKFPETNALVGQNITLECFALGNPIPKMQWKKMDGDLPATHEIVMAGGQLRLMNVQYEDEGTYECEAINAKGKDWHRAKVNVEAAPEWVEHIISGEQDIGSSYTMPCEASGKPKPHIRWLKNGHPYGKHEVKFDELVFEDSGMYQCIAENRHSTIFANAELRVFAGGPTFELNPVKRKNLGAKNGRMVIECKPRAAPKPLFSWSKETEMLSNSSRILIWEDGSLEILNLTKGDDGRYTCFAENERGRANSTGSLSIKDATMITLAPSSADVPVGEDVRMQCAASHDSALDITFIWSLDGRAIDFDREREHYERVEGDSSGEMQIKSTQLKHAGHYTCTAQTPVDNVTASAELVVRGPPGAPGGVRLEEVREKAVRLIWSQGKDNHSPISKYTIQYRDLRSAGEWREAVTSPPIVEGNAETATVDGLIPYSEYEFRVIATNTLGTGDPSDPSRKVTTLEAVPVVAPSDVGGGGGTKGELIITWTPMQPEYFYGKNFGYIVAFKPLDGSEWRKVTVADPQARRYVHKDSSTPPFTEFEVKVKAFNDQGGGPYSLTAIVNSAQDVPSEAPSVVDGRALSATEAMLFWSPVMPQSIKGYQLKYWRKQVENNSTNPPIMVSNWDNQTRLEKLKPNSHYVMEVRAFNSAGLGPAKRVEVSTKKAPPSRPPKIVSTKLNPGGASVNIMWEHVQPLANESKVDGYKILYRHDLHGPGQLYQTPKQHIDLPIHKDGNSLIEVRAHTEGGDGAVAQVRIPGGQTGGARMDVQSLSLAALLLVALWCVGL
ncbi:contactin-1a [Clupea harengus]|uniref:Contactin-1a n=1 Tax=Clupea harengus TaxID=7950 RepID=A0A6P8FAA1_CLUHA|nr:contactin-1a [Clupea harengus]XP_031420836.1 contactin-1a [Clupea harengus]